MNPIYSLLIIIPIFIISYSISRKEGLRNFKKYRNLDGLRGVASIFVFISHSCLFYFYKEYGTFGYGACALHNSNFSCSFYRQCGNGAVTLFFMMSAFLFYGKVKSSSEVDWIKLYTSRFLRLSPMYFVSSVIGILILYIYRINNNFSFHDAVHILFFNGVGNINGVASIFGVTNAQLMTNATAWTLPYEWALYIALPFLYAVTHHGKFRDTFLSSIALFIFILFSNYNELSYNLFIFFLSGIVAYEIHNSCSSSFKNILKSRKASIFVMFISVIIILTSNTSTLLTSSIPVILYSIIFIIISNGNDMFGVLSSATARKIGDLSYSFYIMQFIFLWSFFGIATRELKFTMLEHFCIAGIVGSLLFLFSHISYNLIELPPMNKVGKISSAIKEKLNYILFFKN